MYWRIPHPRHQHIALAIRRLAADEPTRARHLRRLAVEVPRVLVGMDDHLLLHPAPQCFACPRLHLQRNKRPREHDDPAENLIFRPEHERRAVGITTQDEPLLRFD